MSTQKTIALATGERIPSAAIIKQHEGLGVDNSNNEGCEVSDREGISGMR